MTTSFWSISLLVRLPFCGILMDLSSFIHVVDPTKVKVVERERVEGERKFLESSVGRVVPLLPVASARSESELEASVDKLFDEGGSADQGDSAAGGGHDAEIELVTVAKDVAAVTAERPRRQRKNRPAAMDASGSSHPPKKLRGDHITSSEAATGSKSPSVLKELLASSILSAEGGDHTDSITGLNLRTIGPSKKFIISLHSSHHSSTNATEAEVDSFIRSAAPLLVMTAAVITSHAVNVPFILVPDTGNKTTSPVHASIFHDSDSTGTAIPDVAGPSYSTKQDLSMGSQELNTETFHQIREMDYHYLYMEFNVGTARQACLNAEVRMRTDYCLIERSRFSEIEKCGSWDTNKKGRMHLTHTRFPASGDHGFRNMIRSEEPQNKQRVSKDAQQEYEYLTALGLDINRAIEKGMQSRMSAVLVTTQEKSAGPFTEAPGMSELQPDIKQLTLSIHCPEDQIGLGET
ncbi:hypothetical protein Tco_1250438 [Tanacetum coccineum]